MADRKPVVSVIGRPNVGKSSLFNRLIGKRVAVVDKSPGVTRDLNYRDVEWAGKTFSLLDTGGYIPGMKDPIISKVKLQVERGVLDSDLLLFTVDALAGVTDLDMEIADFVRRSGKPYILVVNKVDSESQEALLPEFYRLGLGEPFPVSAMTGRNVGELLERIVSEVSAVSKADEEHLLKVAILGRPNVGKSSFLNRLVGWERAIIHDLPGTTRDPIDTLIEWDGTRCILIDTAGIRRKMKKAQGVEFYSSVRSMQSLERCDVAIVVSDAQEGIVTQDIRIISEAMEGGKGAVLAVNKYDLVPEGYKDIKFLTRWASRRIAPFDHVPVVFTCALTGFNVNRAMDLAIRVGLNREKKIRTSPFNKLIQEIMDTTPPPSRKGKNVKIFYGTQDGVSPPSFVFFSNRPDLIDENYLRFLERRIREKFGFEGVPIRMKVRMK